MGLPPAGCLKENPNLEWMMTGGTPMTMETPFLAFRKLVRQITVFDG